MPHLKLFPALVLLLADILVLGQANAQTTINNETLPRRLVERLLGSPDVEQQILVGQLPKSLPVQLPLPDNAQIIGSTVTNQENFQILLDVPQPPAQVQAFYQERLSTAGWKAQPSFPQQGGFVPSGISSIPILSFCQGTEGPLLLVRVMSVPNAPTDVRLTLENNSGGLACSQGDTPPPVLDVPFPTLVAPPNTQVSPRGGGGSNDYQVSRAILKTELDTQDLAEYYEDQFKQAGWTRLSGQLNRSGVLSTWTYKDEKGKSWLGVLSFTPVEGMENQYSGSVMVSQL